MVLLKTALQEWLTVIFINQHIKLILNSFLRNSFNYFDVGEPQNSYAGNVQRLVFQTLQFHEVLTCINDGDLQEMRLQRNGKMEKLHTWKSQMAISHNVDWFSLIAKLFPYFLLKGAYTLLKKFKGANMLERQIFDSLVAFFLVVTKYW